jgi:hypothetical protein
LIIDFKGWAGITRMILNMDVEEVKKIEVLFKIRMKPTSTRLLVLLIKLIFLDSKG